MFLFLMCAIALRLVTLNFDITILGLGLAAMLVVAAGVHAVHNRPQLKFIILRAAIFRVHFIMFMTFTCGVLVAIHNGFSAVLAISDVFRVLVIISLLYFGLIFGLAGKQQLIIYHTSLLLLFMNFFALLSLFGLGKSEIVEGVTRPIGLAGYSEVMGHLSLFSTLLGAHILLNSSYYKFNRGVVFLSLAIGCAAVVLSNSLKNVIMLVPGVFLVFIFSGSKLKFLTKRFIFTAPIILLAFLFYSDGFIYRLGLLYESGLNVDIREGDIVGSSLAFRILHWKLLLSDWADNYYVVGAGTSAAPYMKGFGHYAGHTLDVHSDILKFLIEFGIVGFLLVSYCHYAIVRELFAFRRSIPLAGFCLSVMFVFTVVGMFGKVFFSAYNMYFFSLYLGLYSGVRYSRGVN